MNHRKSKMGASRDLGISGAGKGDKSRVSDESAFRENFDAIDWGPKLPSRDETVDKFKINPAWATAPYPGFDGESWDR